MEGKTINILNVSCSELQEGMVILSYTGFDDKYQKLTSKSCQWFRINFAGCEFKIKRSGNEMSVSADNIEIGDHILAITNLPKSLKKISEVTEPLKAELARRGFKYFQVSAPRRLKPRVSDRMKICTEQTNQLVENVIENRKYREEAAEAIEYFLDNARKGIIKEKKIKGFVDELFDKSSIEALSAIASLKKSDQTYGHCVDVSAIYSNVYLKLIDNEKLNSAFSDEKELAFAGFVHDFGKAKIPKDILDSTALFDFDSPEMNIMRSHPSLGVELVRNMTQSNTILNMVMWHHVKLDPTTNSSYPEKPEGMAVLLETTLLSIIDAYQSLIGRRSYKKAWSPAAAVRYLDALAGTEYNLSVWKGFQKIIGDYPVSSLVELSDKSIAFVVNSSEKDPANPQVVIVQNADGQWIEQHELLDLSNEQDINIIKDLDAQDYFKNDALNAFTRIRLI